MPMTFMPALPSSAASIPPTAPIPTMTTSVFSVAITIPPALQTSDWRTCERLFALHIRLRENGLGAREADQAPASKVLVAAVDRIGEHAFHCVRPDNVEKLLRRGPCELCCLALFERRDHFILPHGLEPYEWLVIGFSAVRIKLGNPSPVEVLKICVCAREREIDVVDDSRIVRARFARCTGHQSLGERRNGGGIVVVEERSVSIAARMELSGRVCVLLRLVVLGAGVGHELCTRNGSRTHDCAHQECTACGILLGHRPPPFCVMPDLLIWPLPFQTFI